jgi:hypothetical protein
MGVIERAAASCPVRIRDDVMHLEPVGQGARGQLQADEGDLSHCADHAGQNR